jgi:PadR family transcriptional regulator PadR
LRPFALSRKDRYGYDVSEYPVRAYRAVRRHRVPHPPETQGGGAGYHYLSEESGGPPRKYYTLTQQGRERYESDKRDWMEFIGHVQVLLEGKEDE